MTHLGDLDLVRHIYFRQILPIVDVSIANNNSTFDHFARESYNWRDGPFSPWLEEYIHVCVACSRRTRF
jgi:aspartyl/asparaginyl beta-hydroxylase (cupin superfamily)